MKVTVLYFAVAREKTGLSREELTLEGPEAPKDVRALLDALCARHPALAEVLKHLRVAVSQEFVALDAAVPDGAEVALIPPVAGGAGVGAGLFRVVDRPLDLDEVIAAVGGPSQGALVTFTGVVRDKTRSREVVRLEYEAYGPMAERKLSQIGAALTQEAPGTRVAIMHRVGTLVPGDAAVIIAVSAPHRAEAFRACERCIEWLKAEVPIWKKEIFVDGDAWVGLGP